MELGNIRSGEEVDAYLGFVPGFLVVLRQFLPDLSRPRPNDGILAGVVVWRTPEHLDSKSALL